MINDDSAEIWIDPIYRVDRNSKINVKNLHATPGRFFFVDGNPTEYAFDEALNRALKEEGKE